MRNAHISTEVKLLVLGFIVGFAIAGLYFTESSACNGADQPAQCKE